MRIVSWNIHSCIGTDGHYLPERIAEVLISLDADVIALQEVDSSLKADDGRDQLTWLASRVGRQAIMGPTLERDYGAYGNALLVRGDIVAWEEFDLSYRRFEPRGGIAASVICRQRSIRFVNTHLGLKSWERAFQIDELLKRHIWSGDFLTIVAGDFNEWWPFSSNNRRLQNRFRKAPRLATFPSFHPRFALDRIFVSGDISSVDYSVRSNTLTRVASDHLPLLAEIELSIAESSTFESSRSEG